LRRGVAKERDIPLGTLCGWIYGERTWTRSLQRTPVRLYYKRLDATQLAMLLDGIDVKRVPPPKRWIPSSAKK
jgi:hypothetical protein